jgi:glycosyltransferase involved in cell wall biosynthesis
MRIAYPVDWSDPGPEASVEQAVNTAAALGRQGASVTLLAPRRRSDPSLTAETLAAQVGAGAQFSLTQRDSRWAGPLLAPSALWLRRAMLDPLVAAADVVLTRIPAALIMGGDLGRPFVFDHYRPWPDQWPLGRPFFKRTIESRRCLGVIAHSQYAADSYAGLRVPPAKVMVTHNGHNPDSLADGMSKREARQRIGLPCEGSLVLYAGRINEAKGLEAVLAMAALRPHVRFVLVGSEGEGPIERSARRLANVTVAPWQTPDALPAYLRAADVLIIPPSLAPLQRFGNCVLPLKTFRYLAAGRPILAPRAPDTAELLVDGVTAALTDPNPAAATAVLDRLLGDRALAGRLAAAAQARAQTLTWDERAKRILSFIEQRLDATPDS